MVRDGERKKGTISIESLRRELGFGAKSGFGDANVCMPATIV